MQARRECNQIFKGLKWKPYQPRTLNIVKLSFKCEEEINIPSEKQKLRQYITSHPDLQKKRNKRKTEVLQQEGKWCRSEMWISIQKGIVLEKKKGR